MLLSSRRLHMLCAPTNGSAGAARWTSARRMRPIVGVPAELIR
jgi:hypothetical protein